MRYIVAIEFDSCFRAIARVSSLETAKLLQLALEQTFGFTIIIINTRGL